MDCAFCQPRDHGDNSNRHHLVAECHPPDRVPRAAPNRTGSPERGVLPPPAPCRDWQAGGVRPLRLRPSRHRRRPAPPRPGWTLDACGPRPLTLLVRVKKQADDLFNEMSSVLLFDKDASIVTKRSRQCHGGRLGTEGRPVSETAGSVFTRISAPFAGPAAVLGWEIRHRHMQFINYDACNAICFFLNFIAAKLLIMWFIVKVFTHMWGPLVAII